MNLACTDFLTCTVSIPLDLAILAMGRWPYGAAMCKIVYPLQTLLLAVSIGTLLCMSFERHRAIVHPFKRQPKRKTILWVCAFVWLVGLLLVSPYSYVLEYQDNDCTEAWPQSKDYPRLFTMCVFLILFAGPLAIITVIYARVGLRLRRENLAMCRLFPNQPNDQSNARDGTHVRIVKKFVCAVVAFALCLSPYQVMWMWADFGDGRSWAHFSAALTFANVIAYSNSIINPFIFGSLDRRCRTCGDRRATAFGFVSSVFRRVSTKNRHKRSICGALPADDTNARILSTTSV